ncbi:hypothetical protein GGR58DRAFT_513583 [Xylaria digitata]|nr:hypothetical protein GGR58DRAFT_513583 [Xylaria digitata]
MRLINVNTFKLEEFLEHKAPHYAILSHTWGEDHEELSLRDVQEGIIDKPGVGSVKVQGSCRQAKKDGLGYVWVDTCCIDKANLVELSEAINSMFRWYKRASICYAYLSDVPSNDLPRRHGSKFRASRWFQRGWTLQELLAPKNLRFYNSEWHTLGTKGSMWAILEEITGVPRRFLLGIAELYTAGIAQRMSWAAQRDTKRKEDLAYCLLGVFGVSMPMIYGEGGNQAFFRLQEQIMKISKDDSILAWGLRGQDPSINNNTSHVTTGRILAAAPSDFTNSGQIVPREQSTMFLNPLDISGGSLRTHLSIRTTPTGENDTEQIVGIPLTKALPGSSDEYIRPRGCSSVLQPVTTSRTPPELVHIKNDNRNEKPANTNQQYWLYNHDQLANLGLEVIDVAPRGFWNEEQDMVISTITPSSSASNLTLLRLRNTGRGPQDFVIGLNLRQQGTRVGVECCIMTCARNTQLGELVEELDVLLQIASGKKRASNGLIHLCVGLESNAQQPIFTINVEKLHHRPATINATVELQGLYLTLAMAQTWEEDERQRAKKWELDKKTKEKTKQDGDFRTPLFYAAMNGHLDVVQLLLSTKKANVNAGDRNGRTPLSWAAEKGHETIVRLLLQNGADVRIRDGDSRRALSYATTQGHEIIVQLLLSVSMAFLPDSKLLATASDANDAIIRLWDATTGKLWHTFKDRHKSAFANSPFCLDYTESFQRSSITSPSAQFQLWYPDKSSFQQVNEGLICTSTTYTHIPSTMILSGGSYRYR